MEDNQILNGAERYPYPRRVTQGQDGNYRWLAATDGREQGKPVRITLYTVFGICAFLLVFGLVLTRGVLRDMLPIYFSIAVVMAITILVCVLYVRLGGAPAYENYLMTWEGISAGTGTQANVGIKYRDADAAVIYPDRIDLKSGARQLRIFIPPEDYVLVRDFIRSRLPYGCRVEAGGMEASFEKK